MRVSLEAQRPPPPCFTALVGDESQEDPPVPIPNTEVKLHGADGTATVTLWESRSSPTILLSPAFSASWRRGFHFRSTDLRSSDRSGGAKNRGAERSSSRGGGALHQAAGATRRPRPQGSASSTGAPPRGAGHRDERRPPWVEPLRIPMSSEPQKKD